MLKMKLMLSQLSTRLELKLKLKLKLSLAKMMSNKGSFSVAEVRKLGKNTVDIWSNGGNNVQFS